MSAPESPQLLCRTGLLAERWPLLEVSGEIDIATAAGLRAELSRATAQISTDIVVDLSKVFFIDAAGLSALVAGLQTLDANRRGATLRLVGATSQVRKVLAVTGLDRVFPMHDTREELMACPACHQRRALPPEQRGSSDQAPAEWHAAGQLWA